ncbi:uncharacterized protein K489DRAFT_144347 [Dissoconium aciculare CBS 342.82]|uniref:Uncharacterized protein n=1 Tax=Dissoconium aciculare CBS 342.82 TaxID=1314786 RepID=A0A6J3MA36_9PEZI|nr:uncharacterized protein K489DRAFT_144347 [Dissoconium aciculare CBS 342.82]KAF1824896.1 hypothetical protein K489DRAFT_144347 [Dissoconium aciculare CBS 342.82]
MLMHTISITLGCAGSNPVSSAWFLHIFATWLHMQWSSYLSHQSMAVISVILIGLATGFDSGFMSCFCRGVRLTPWLLRDEKPTGGETIDVGMGGRHLLSRCMPVRS